MKTHIISIVAGLVCCGSLTPVAMPQALAEVEAPAPADTSTSAKLLKTVADTLAKSGVLETKRAAAIAAAPIEVRNGIDGISVFLVKGKPVFNVQPDLLTTLEQKAASMHAENAQEQANEWCISAMAGACAEADLLLALGEEKAAELPAETRRGFAFCMENNAVNLLCKKQIKLEDFSDAISPAGDTELAIHMIAGEGRNLVNLNEETHLFIPNYKDLTLSDRAQKTESGKLASASPSSSPAATDKDTCVHTSDAFKKAIEELAPLSDPTDIEGFRKGLHSLLVHESRALRLVVRKESQERSFESLTASEAAKSKHWYHGPQVSLELSPDWVRYYAGTVVPRLDAFYRSAAKNVDTYEPVCVVKRLDSGALELWYENTDWFDEVRRHGEGYSKFCITTPIHPEEIEHAKAGSRVHFKVMVYYLPKAFEAPGTYWWSYNVYGHIYDQKGEYIGSIQDKCKWNLNNERYDLGWTFYWAMECSVSEPVLTERQFFLKEGQEYGGCLVSFRDAATCFPKLQKGKKESAESKTATNNSDEVSLSADQVAAIATNPTVILLSIFAIVFIGACPWMIWTFYAEHRRKLPLLPEPDEATEGTYSMESLELEMLSDIMAPALAWSAEIEIKEDENGGTIGVLPSKKMVDTGFAVMHELFRSADKMQPCDRFYYNRLAELLNDSQKRYLNGSNGLLGIIGLAVIGSIAATCYFSCPYLLLYTAVALNYALCLMCPLYKALRPAPLFVRGLRGLLAGVGIFSTMFATNLIDNKYVTVYRDNMGNLYHDRNEASDHNAMGVGIMLMVAFFFVVGLPIFMMVDGACNFLRNYITQK